MLMPSMMIYLFNSEVLINIRKKEFFETLPLIKTAK